VFLILETLRKTTLGSRRVGERVNLEIDYIAKLILQQSWHYTVPLLKGMSKRNRRTDVDWGKRVGREAW
jgi:riboflavin synthase alpha subunit